MLLSNAFSINMIVQGDLRVRFSRIGRDEAAWLIQDINENVDGEEHLVNIIGHSDLDRIARSELMQIIPDLEIPPGKRLNAVFAPDLDTSHRMLVAQYRGPRLPEGTSVLPEGAEIEWWLVTAIAEEN